MANCQICKAPKRVIHSGRTWDSPFARKLQTQVCPNCDLIGTDTIDTIPGWDADPPE